MNVRTPRWVERRYRWRLSLHVFRWGLHWKYRRGNHWRHLVLKLSSGSAFGSPMGRRMLWLGYWESRKGTRGRLRGWRFVVAADRLPERPTAQMRIPFFPQPERVRPGREGRRFEVR